MIKNILKMIPGLKKTLMWVKRKDAFTWLKSSLAFVRIMKPFAWIFGPAFKMNPACIEIDITYRCNVRCVNCNRSCGQAPTDDSMTVDQIKRFIGESIKNNVQWKSIRLLGGEPTLHPDFFEIMDLFMAYKRNYRPNLNLILFSNGAGDLVNDILRRVPDGIAISNAGKEVSNLIATAYPTKEKTLVIDFNNAPKDSLINSLFDYRNGCWLPQRDGMGLSLSGYYCCSTACGIDRVFGFNKGRQNMPRRGDLMLEQRLIFCRLCGFFWGKEIDSYACNPTISYSWQEAYKKYKINKPELTKY